MLYIRFRKRFVLPVVHFLAERKIIKNTVFPDVAVIMERVDGIKKKLLLAQKRENRFEIAEFSARLDELNWVLYGNSKNKES